MDASTIDYAGELEQLFGLTGVSYKYNLSKDELFDEALANVGEISEIDLFDKFGLGCGIRAFADDDHDHGHHGNDEQRDPKPKAHESTPSPSRATYPVPRTVWMSRDRPSVSSFLRR